MHFTAGVHRKKDPHSIKQSQANTERHYANDIVMGGGLLIAITIALITDIGVSSDVAVQFIMPLLAVVITALKHAPGPCEP